MKNSLKIESNLLVSFKSIDEISRECLRYVDIVDLKILIWVQLDRGK